jgi:hypothetical protein
LSYQQKITELRDKFVEAEEEHFGTGGNFSDLNYEDFEILVNYLVGEVVKIKDEECREKMASVGGARV